MLIGIFSDVHGNFINLNHYFKITAELGIEKHICLGDLCNYYPENIKVIDLMRDNKNILTLMGNHDEIYAKNIHIDENKKSAYNYDYSLINSELHLTYLRKLNINHISEDSKETYYCHGSPSDNVGGYLYPDSDLGIFDQWGNELFFMGHTHRQFLRQNNGKTFCNVGSIGLPRDNGSLMGFAVLDSETFNIELYRAKINIEEVMDIYANNTPQSVLELLKREEKLMFSYTLIDEI